MIVQVLYLTSIELRPVTQGQVYRSTRRSHRLLSPLLRTPPLLPPLLPPTQSLSG